MSDFLKCECSHCGQRIEYPSEGIGQIVPCPTCENSVTLTNAVKREEVFYETPLPEVTIPKVETINPQENSERQKKEKFLLQQRKELAKSVRKQKKELQNQSPKILSQKVTIPHPKREKPAALMLENPREKFGSIIIPPAPAQKTNEKKPVATDFSKLTEETIGKRNSAGDTPLHKAAGLGKIGEIPKHLLKLELFLEMNNSNRTPIHRAARNGFLDKVPKEFLTRETMTASAEYENKKSKTGSTPPRHETPLHTAALHGHADQIPKEFLKLEFLSIEATGYRQTVLEYLLLSNSLGVIPGIYSNSKMLDYKNSRGWTLRQSIEFKKESSAAVARVRNEPATEQQKEKLRFFGCTFGNKITKGQASDAIDECVRRFPQKNTDYYNRPATEEQLAKLQRTRNKTLTYGQAKDLISERAMEKRHRDRVREIEENARQLVIMEFLRSCEDYYRHLTYSRVKIAAGALDKINPEWTKSSSSNREILLLQKVCQLYPQIGRKWD
jgi:hypothetical protein